MFSVFCQRQHTLPLSDLSIRGETQSRQERMAGICILQEKAAKSARPERRQRVQTHVGTRTMTCTANSAALPPCLSSPWSRDGGQGRHIHTGTSGGTGKGWDVQRKKKQKKCGDSRLSRGTGCWRARGKKKFKRCAKGWWRGRRGRRKWEEVGISHSVTINWTAITWLLAFLALLQIDRRAHPSKCLSKRTHGVVRGKTSENIRIGSGGTWWGCCNWWKEDRKKTKGEEKNKVKVLFGTKRTAFQGKKTPADTNL